MTLKEYAQKATIGDTFHLFGYHQSKIFTVKKLWDSKNTAFEVEGNIGGTHIFNFSAWGSLTVTIIKSNNSSSMSDLKTKFSLLLKSEPEKSFIQAGIIDSNEVLTPDGQTVFLSWLLSKNGDLFKTEVVDKLLASDKE